MEDADPDRRVGRGILPRIHALWGLEQASRRTEASQRASLWNTLAPLLAAPEPELRAQAARIAGLVKESKSFERLTGLLDDPSARVRFFAAIALGKLGRADAAEPLLKLLRQR